VNIIIDHCRYSTDPLESAPGIRDRRRSRGYKASVGVGVVVLPLAVLCFAASCSAVLRFGFSQSGNDRA